MLQIILVLIVFFIIILPTGKYLYQIALDKKTFADPVFNPIDHVIYRICGIGKDEMNWKQYAIAMLSTNGLMAIAGYLILRLPSFPFLNPNRIGAMEPSLAFNTVISFITNTDLQHYSGESGLSYFSQMMVIIFLMFTSSATGFSVCMAFLRGITGKCKTVGNYYRDMVRIITRVLIPLSLVLALFLVSQGVPQNLSANVTVQTVEGKFQDLAMGPIAALESIKHLGTNGGGFLGANSAAPFENPNVLTNIAEMLAMMVMPGSFVVAFGHMAGSRKKEGLLGREARPLLAVMCIILLAGLMICFLSESNGNPILLNAGLDQSMGNMEGKEVRFGIAQSALFTTVTTAFTTGSVNNMHDSLTPLGGASALMNMMLNVVFGGKGVGLMNMILYAILAVFICGLMIGRTPEYLGKKIEGKEMKLAALGIIIHPMLILLFTALAVSVPSGLAGITNPGYHGLTQILYEFSSSAANNGSGFEGLSDNTLFYNVTTGLVMFFGRYLGILISLAISGSLLIKHPVNQSTGTLKTDTGTFTVSLLMVVLIIAALTFFPVMVLGPVAEHLILWS
jgi:K+-transporting ATPase ATPase A chain